MRVLMISFLLFVIGLTGYANIPDRYLYDLYSPGDCVQLIEHRESKERWENPRTSLRAIYKIKEVGKKSYLLDRLIKDRLDKEQWSTDETWSFWLIHKKETVGESAKIDCSQSMNVLKSFSN